MATKKFILFFQDNDNTIIGSDQYLPIDARKSEFRIKDEMSRYNPNVSTAKKQGAIGYRICTGELRAPKYISELIMF